MKQTNSKNNKSIVNSKLSHVSAVRAFPNSFNHLLVEALLYCRGQEQYLVDGPVSLSIAQPFFPFTSKRSEPLTDNGILIELNNLTNRPWISIHKTRGHYP